MDGREWLEQFPKNWQGAIGNWFYNAVRDAGEEGPACRAALCRRVYDYLQQQVDAGSTGAVNKRNVMAGMAFDPEGTMRFMDYVIAETARRRREGK